MVLLDHRAVGVAGVAHRVPDQGSSEGRTSSMTGASSSRPTTSPPSTLYSSLLPGFGAGPMVIMAKEELFEISRLLNWAWRHVGVVCVRRGKGDATVVENTVREVREGRGALVFPEGTRTKDGNLGKLKSGAFVIAAEAGVDMIPCRIIYKGGKMRVFGRCTVVFGKPIPAGKIEAGRAAQRRRLRECKALLAEELEKLLEENRQYL